MGTLLRRCVEVRIAIELSFGVVSGVGPGIHELDGSPRASRERGCFWHGFQQPSVLVAASVCLSVPSQISKTKQDWREMLSPL